MHHPTASELARGLVPLGAGLAYRPYWWEAAKPRDAEQIHLPATSDTVIVGSGYTGLSAALTLARRGRKPLVLERGVPGYGASTRNGGQIGSGNQKFKVAKLVELRGQAKAIALLREGTRMLEFIVELIEREKIDCHFRRCGRFRGAIRPEHYEAMARDLEDLRRAANVEFFMVPRSEQHTEIGTDVFHGGSLLPNDGSLHPGLLHAGLMARVVEAGGEIMGRTEARRIERTGKGFKVATSRGEISARDVIVATDGYTGPLVSELHRRIVSVGSSQIAVGPVPEPLYARLLPKDRVYGNTNRVIYYFRGAPGLRRIVWGGRVGRFARADGPQRYAHLAREMLEVFPDLADVPVTHGWEGMIGYSHDEVPHIGQTREGIWYMLGYSGTGVSRSVYFGHKVALKVLGDPDGRTEFDDLAFDPFPMRPLTQRIVPVVEMWYRVRDRYGF